MRLFLLAALIATPAAAQVTYPPVPIDLSAVPTKADVQAAQDAATAAQSVASAAQTAAASKCAATPVVPGMEVVGGAAGTTGVGCRPVNSVQPRITRSVSFTTGSAGTAAITWTDMGAVPLVFVVPNVANGATQAPGCYPVAGSVTSTGATIKCYTTQSVTVSLLGAVVAPITTAGAGVTGQVLAIPVS
jgi:hypothetical protein